MRYRTRMDLMVGDPGLFGAIGKLVGRVASVAAPFIPGGSIVKGAVGLAGSAIGAIASRPSAPPGGGVSRVSTMMSGLQPGQIEGKRKGRAIEKVGVSPYGTVGVKYGKKSRRMNVGNARAARRAIRRIKGVRHLLQSIERELPHRKAVAHHPAGRR